MYAAVRNGTKGKDDFLVNPLRASMTAEKTAAKRKAAKAKAKANPAPKKVDVVKEEEDADEPSWWRAIFFGGRFPGESVEDYRARLSVQGYPCNQPFK